MVLMQMITVRISRVNSIVPFPGDNVPPGGRGPEGPSMEERVSKLEQAVASIDGKLSRLSAIEAHVAEIKSQLSQTAKTTDVAEIKGQLAQMPKAVDFGRLERRLQQLPTTLQLVTVLITTWAAGAAIVFTLLRITGR
jgi:hypothetical protein